MIRKTTTACLMFFFLWYSSVQGASAADVRQIQDTALLIQKVELFGIGANVKVKLTNGQKMKGVISSIDDTGFEMVSSTREPARLVSYNEISELTLVSKRYRASEAPDASEARRVVAALGVGAHVMVRTGDRKIHGQINAVAGDHFVILPDDEVTPTLIAYQDVHQIGKNLGFLSTIGLVVIVIVAIVVISKVK